MTKYSTGGSRGGDGGGSCELCGKSTDDLRAANVAGAKLQVCADCAPHDDTDYKDQKSSGGDDGDRKRRAAQNAARAADATGGDSTHWEEEGTSYDDDPLPYLVRDYGQRAEDARQDAGLQRDELAAEIDVDENDILAIEQGRATQANVGGSVVEAVEDYLDVTLTQE